MLLNYLLLQSFRFDGKGKLRNSTELFYHLDLISALPDSCYVYKMKRNNSIKNDLILQKVFPLKTFHEVLKIKYGDLNQEPLSLKS